MELAALQGSEKQIAWATEIRTRMLEAAQSRVQEMTERIARAEQEGNEASAARNRRGQANWAEGVRVLSLIPHASWFINHREADAAYAVQILTGPSYAGWLSSNVYSRVERGQARIDSIIAEARLIFEGYNGE